MGRLPPSRPIRLHEPGGDRRRTAVEDRGPRRNRRRKDAQSALPDRRQGQGIAPKGNQRLTVDPQVRRGARFGARHSQIEASGDRPDTILRRPLPGFSPANRWPVRAAPATSAHRYPKSLVDAGASAHGTVAASYRRQFIDHVHQVGRVSRFVARFALLRWLLGASTILVQADDAAVVVHPRRGALTNDCPRADGARRCDPPGARGREPVPDVAPGAGLRRRPFASHPHPVRA